MSSSDQILWLANAYGAVMIVAGLWMAHRAKALNRRIDEAEARMAQERRPAE